MLVVSDVTSSNASQPCSGRIEAAAVVGEGSTCDASLHTRRPVSDGDKFPFVADSAVSVLGFHALRHWPEHL